MNRRTCECGECQKCKHRAYMYLWYRKPGNAEKRSAARALSYQTQAEKIRSKVREYREKNIERVREYDRSRRYRPTSPEKASARKTVLHAVRNGLLSPEACEGCGLSPGELLEDGRRRVHAHHDDYSKPLDVRWLCSTCHGIEHRIIP